MGRGVECSARMAALTLRSFRKGVDESTIFPFYLDVSNENPEYEASVSGWGY